MVLAEITKPMIDVAGGIVAIIFFVLLYLLWANRKKKA